MKTAGMDRTRLYAVEEGSDPRAASAPVPAVLAELREYLDERVIPRLPVSCEWRWVAVQLHQAVARQSRRV